MNSIFAKRRARLLAMKAIRDNYIPGDKLITCPKCGQESERKTVAEGQAHRRPAQDRPHGGRRHSHRYHRRPQMCGGRAGQPLFHGQHECRRG